MGAFFLISSRSDSYLNLWIYGQNSTDSWRTTRYDGGQNPRNKASKIQKLAFRCFLLTSAKAKKFQDGDRSIRLYTTISLQLRRFFSLLKTAHPQKLAFWKQCPRNIKIEYSQRFACNTHIHTHTHTDKLTTITLRLRARVWGNW